MRSLYFLSFLLGGASFFSMLEAPKVWAMDASEEALFRDSAQNDKEGEEADYQRHFRQQEEQRVAEEEKKRANLIKNAKENSAKKQSPDVAAYLSAHNGAKTALTPPPAILGEMGEADPMPTLSPEESKKAGQMQLQAQLQNAQHQMQKKENKNVLSGSDSHQRMLNRYFPSEGRAVSAQNTGSSYENTTGHTATKWKSQLPGMTVDELLGETQGSLIDALELCPPSPQEDYRLDLCLKHHSPPEWWTADLKRSDSKLLVEKWKALKTIKVKKENDPLGIYANWLAEMIPQEFTLRHHPEFISALVKPKPAQIQAKAQEASPKPQQNLAPPPLNLAEAKAAFEGGLQKPKSIPSLEEEKSLSHQKQEQLAEKRTESYIGEDNAQYLYPVAPEAGHSYQPGELRPPSKTRHAPPPPPLAGVEAYRDE